MLPSPDPEAAFIARIRTIVGGGVAVSTRRETDECVVVDLIDGQTEVCGVMDRVRLDLVFYGSDPRARAALVRRALGTGFREGDARVRKLQADPPMPNPDPQTFEPTFRVPLSASIYAVPA